MAAKKRLRTLNPPPRPLLIWDGNCDFCGKWIERWRELTGGEIDYATSQEVAEQFPEIPRAQFEKSVVFIKRNGDIFFGAEAVYLSLRPSKKWPAWCYDRIPGFAAVSELAYKMVAWNRGLSSAITWLAWGKETRVPTYFATRKWFLSALGLVFLIAFLSFNSQVDGLIGRNGVLPLGIPPQQFDWRSVFAVPTLCWFNSSNTFLHLLCYGGVALSLLLIFRVIPLLSLAGLFVLYLSLTVAGQTFLNFQWDILLLETGFLAIFVAPWQIWPRRGHEPPVSRAGLFLLKLLLFKLLFMSGVAKLTSGDDSWWNLTALDYHYWSQPLPTVFAWWADHHAEWFKKFSVAFCLVVEVIVPFFMWGPRRLRHTAAALIIILQIAIAITGNYCFFNLLTIALCLLLLDDSIWRRRRTVVTNKDRRWSVSTVAATVVLIFTLPLNAWFLFTAIKPRVAPPAWVGLVYQRIQPFRIVNSYGLFRVMTRDRREIIIEGSADGVDWLPYEFKWKPGDVRRRPGWCAPHQPRLDWQMWFAALGNFKQNRWFARLLVCLFDNKPEVVRLLQHNPFPEEPPRYLRARFYRYRFTSAEEHRQTGAWWKREELGEYLPTVTRDQIR